MNVNFTPITPLVFIVVALLIASSCRTGQGNSNINSIPAPRTTPAPPELELSGVYKVSGADEMNGNPYEGILTVTNQEDAYRFIWETNRSRHSGVGVQMGDAVAVTYADSAGGKGCGVALYKIGSDGSLDGKIAKWGEFRFGAEKAIHVEGKNFDGKYSVAGTTNEGKKYEGTIEVQKNGKGYQFKWHTETESVGFGIWRGDHAAISFGGTKCSFALYKVVSRRSLEGQWGSQRVVAFGTETAKRQ